MQRAKVGIPAQTDEAKQLLEAIDNKRSKDKVKQRAREEKKKNEKIEQKQQRREARELEDKYDQENNPIKYGQQRQDAEATGANQVNGGATSSKAKVKAKRLTEAEKREIYEQEGGTDKYWECDICKKLINKNEKTNNDHRWTKNCSNAVYQRSKHGQISSKTLQEMLVDKQATLAKREQDKKNKKNQESSNGKKRASPSKKSSKRKANQVEDTTVESSTSSTKKRKSK